MKFLILTSVTLLLAQASASARDGGPAICGKLAAQRATEVMNIGVADASVFSLDQEFFGGTQGNGVYNLRFTSSKLVSQDNPTGEADCTISFTDFDGNNCTVTTEKTDNACSLYNVNG